MIEPMEGKEALFVNNYTWLSLIKIPPDGHRDSIRNVKGVMGEGTRKQ